MDKKIEQSPEPTREDFPEELITCLIDRMKLGRVNYGAFDQWKQRMGREGYRKKRLKNMIHHLINILVEDYSEDDEYDNIGGVLFGCMILLEFRKRKPTQQDLNAEENDKKIYS